jgi:nucleoid DNA-binding protein
MTKAIMEDTGFRECDIQLVLKSMTTYIKDSLLEGRGVSLPKLGIFYPLLKPARTVMSMNGGIGVPTKMKMSDRWQMKFKGSESIQGLLAKKEPTQQDVENLYVN